jgi:hypothetical protein
MLKSILRRAFSTSLVMLALFFSSCTAVEKLPTNDPHAMIEHHTYWINNQCDIIYGGGYNDPNGKKRCQKNLQLYGYLNYLSHTRETYHVSRIYNHYLDRCFYYLAIDDFSNAILDCKEAKEIVELDINYYSGDTPIKHREKERVLQLLAHSYHADKQYQNALSALNEIRQLPQFDGCANGDLSTVSSIDKLGKKFEAFLYGEGWIDCEWINARIGGAEQALAEEITAKNLRNEMLKEQALAREKIERERREREIEEHQKALEAEKAKQRQREREATARLTAFMEKQRLACKRNKKLPISQIFWENIAAQNKLDPRSNDFEVVDAESSEGFESILTISLFLELQQKPNYHCSITIYHEKGVCRAVAEIVKNDETKASLGLFRDAMLFHNDKNSPCAE